MDAPKLTLIQGDGIRHLSFCPEKGRTHHLLSASQRHMLKAQSRQTTEMVSTIIRAAAFATSVRTQPPDQSFLAPEDRVRVCQGEAHRAADNIYRRFSLEQATYTERGDELREESA